MSRKITKSNLSRDEISLLIHSEEPKNTELYGNLYEIISNLNLKAISIDELPNLNDLGNAAITCNKKALMEITNKEWVIERESGEDPSQRIRCGLCNRPNRYIFYIRNRINGISLNVGSSCINNFPEIGGFTEHKKRIAQMKSGQKVIKRANEFHDRFPDYESIISNAENYFSTLPILLPSTLYTSLDEVIKRMHLICNQYIQHGKKPFGSEYDSFKLFKLAVNQYNRLKTEAEIFASNNINNPLICRRMEIDWLIENKKHNLLQKIAENNGLYTFDTLRHIWCIDYVKNKFNIILDKNKSELIKFEKFNDNNLLFSFNKFGYNPAIIFSVKLSDFMLNIGASCILKQDYRYDSKEVLDISCIENSRNNLVSILNFIDTIMNQFHCAFLFDDRTNSLYLYRKGDKAIRQFDYYNFIMAYSKQILKSDEGIKQYLYTIIKGNNNTKWIDQEHQITQGIDEKVSWLYKEYKLAHEL